MIPTGKEELDPLRAPTIYLHVGQQMSEALMSKRGTDDDHQIDEKGGTGILVGRLCGTSKGSLRLTQPAQQS